MLHEPRFWTAVAFVLFFVIFGRKLWAAIREHLDARADVVRRDLDEAGRLRREAEQMLEDATRERERTLAETRDLLARSESEAAALADRILNEAESVAARYEKTARERIEAAERAVIREVQQRAVQVAVAAARDVVTQRLAEQPELAEKLVEQSLQNLPEALRRSAA